MVIPDPEEERRRLAQLYAGMSEGELQQLAQGAGSLTESAREALKFELSRRGLKVELGDPAGPTDDVESGKVVTLRRFRDLPQALVAKSILDSAGIECLLGDENTIRMDWFWSSALGGVKLWVRREDADAAAAMLDQSIPEVFDVEGVGDYKQPRCPNCQSFDISFEELNKPVSYTTAFLGVPIPLARHRWKCSSCGRVWQKSDDIAK